MNYEKMKLFAMHELMKIFFCNKWIIKLRKCLFAINEL